MNLAKAQKQPDVIISPLQRRFAPILYCILPPWILAPMTSCPPHHLGGGSPYYQARGVAVCHEQISLYLIWIHLICILIQNSTCDKRPHFHEVFVAVNVCRFCILVRQQLNLVVCNHPDFKLQLSLIYRIR